jgi:translation initiation factor IF-3
VVDEKGKQIGVIPTQEALFKARQKGLDLVEVAPEAKPPVCKLIDFKKFKYQESKKLRTGKKRKRQDLKEIRFTPFIAPKDFEVRLNRAKEFLSEGHKIRLTVKFVGRQITRKQFGYDLLSKASKTLGEISKVESEPKFQGRLLMMVLKPSKQFKKEPVLNKAK